MSASRRHAAAHARRAPTVTVGTARGSRALRYLLIGLDAAALSIGWIAAIAWSSNTDQSLALAAMVGSALVAGGIVLFSGLGLYRARICNLRTVEFARIARGCRPSFVT